jgi:hypothetical protein
MTKREALELTHQENRLMALGISREDAEALRRISMTLRRWFELECGMDNGCIERDDETGKAFWLNSYTMRRSPMADRETGARKRLAAIIARYPGLTAYVQGDPRGCSLYILTAEQLASEHGIDSIYTRGVAVA